MNHRLFANRPTPAPARQAPLARTVHGVELVDEYAWLRAQNWRDVLRDPSVLPSDVRAFVEAENAYADSVLDPVQDLRSKLVRELRGRIKEDDADVPAPDGPWEYYQRYREGGENELVCRIPRGGGAEHILLDGDELARDKDFFDLGAAQHSPDHALLAWSADDRGSEFYTIHVRRLADGVDIDAVPDAEGSIVWRADSRAFYYVRLDAEHRPSRVFLHVLGSPAQEDALIFEETDPAWFVHLDHTQSGAFALIDVNDHDSSETFLLDLAVPSATPRLVAPRERSIRYAVEHHGERLFIRANVDGAVDFKIIEAPLNDPGRRNWRDVVAYRPGRMIVAHLAFADHLVRLEQEDGLPRIVIRELAGGDEHVVAFEEQAYALAFEDMLEFNSRILRFSYSSMRTPEEIYDYDMTRRTRVLLKRQEIPSGHEPADYVTRRVFAPAPDGERVPVSLLYRKDTPIDGTAPLLLYGYGAYGHATSASFRPNRLSLVNRGFVYAIAHVRGGADRGWSWYLDGKLEKKPNTFSDFIAAAEFLVREKIVREDAVVAHGGSAGGMLMGAIANRAPRLFAGIIADVPFVDVLNTMLDDSLPLTPPEWLEWGDPIRDREAFKTILGYSPYDNVRAQHYPAILALAGLTDPRVTYWEPAKWVARLRARMSGGGPILLKTNMQAGHGGASGRFEALEEVALHTAFTLACVSTHSRE